MIVGCCRVPVRYAQDLLSLDVVEPRNAVQSVVHGWTQQFGGFPDAHAVQRFSAAAFIVLKQ